MSTNSVKERVYFAIANLMDKETKSMTDDTRFEEDLGCDSLDLVEIVMDLEGEFEIDIPDEAAEKLKTVGQAVEYIEGVLAKTE